MDSIPNEFWQAIEQFNQQQFYDCHDTLEAVWINAVPAEKNFYQGILQIAVALYHLGNLNSRGAVILMGEGINRLRSYQPTYADIDVENFVIETAYLLKQLQQADPSRVELIAQQLGLRDCETKALTHSSPELKLPVINTISD